jgi:hypothetical protein
MPTERSLRRRRRVADAVAVLLGVPRPTPVSAPAPTVPDAAALRDAARRISDAIATAGQRDQLRDAHQPTPRGATVITARTPDAPLRITSDGTGSNTHVYLGDHEVPGVLAATWHVGGGDGTARALLEVEGVHVTHDRAANGATPADETAGPRVRY